MSSEAEIRQRALRFLSRTPHSRNQLARKLARRHSRKKIDAVLDELEELGLLDDAALALDRARYARASRRWGELRIRADLRRLGISAKIVDSVLIQLNQESSEQPALESVIESWTAKHGKPATLADTKKLFDHCLRRGFGGERVRETIDRTGNWAVESGK